MATRVTAAQLRSKLQQIASKRRQAINRYNQQVHQHNQRVAQQVRAVNAAINRHNQEVRSHNNRVRAHQQRLHTEITRLRAQSTPRHVEFRQSVLRVNTAYETVDRWANSSNLSPQETLFADLAEKETANTVSLFNMLEGDEHALDNDEGHTVLQETRITDEIALVSQELNSRWRGALFALHPRNPEAARHFCTSVREIFTEILGLTAPDSAVFSVMPNCSRTQRGNATRRSKIEYLLNLKGIRNDSATSFVDEDIDNVIKLFEVLNGATHGESGRLALSTLRQVKQRVEDGLVFLCRIAT